MPDADAKAYTERMFAFICRDIGQSLRRVDITRGELTVHKATSGELTMWENKEKGGFRRFPRRLADWTTSDHRKFLLLLRGPTTFFVALHDEDAQFYPSRASAG